MKKEILKNGEDLREKTVEITLWGKDEAYCEWFKCGKCGDTMITANSNFCPNCGGKIKKS